MNIAHTLSTTTSGGGDDDDTSDANANTNGELSVTLVQRRKRLHELGTKINQWEDEPSPNIRIANGQEMSDTTTVPPAPPPPPMCFDMLNRTASINSRSYSSPHNQQQQHAHQQYVRNRSPSPYKPPSSSNNYSHNTSKENRSPATYCLPPQPKQFITPISSSEIISTAQRMIAKRQLSTTATSNSAPTTSSTTTSSSNCLDNQTPSSTTLASVKSIKAMFESNGSSVADSANSAATAAVSTTPKSLISKFEQMSNAKTSSSAGTVCTNAAATAAPRANSLNRVVAKAVTSHLPPLPPNNSKSQKVDNDNNVNDSSIGGINTDHIDPKNIIQKFEQRIKQITNTTGAGVTAPAPAWLSDKPSSHTTDNAGSSNTHGVLSTRSTSVVGVYSTGSTGGGGGGTGSLTYVSSMVSNSTMSVGDESEDANDDTADSDVGGGGSGTVMVRDAVEENEYDELSMGDDDVTTTTATSLFNDTSTMARGPHEASMGAATSYTGSLMDDRGYDDDDDHDANEEDYHDDDDEDDLTSDSQTTADDTEQSSQTIYGDETASATRYDINDETVVSMTAADNTNQQQPAPPPAPQQQQQQPALFSISEYRKQKRRMLNGGRRSSIMPAAAAANSNNPKQSLLIATTNTNNQVKQQQQQQAAANKAKQAQIDQSKSKQAKLDKIRELDELIKQEENVIHQTGVALERCLSDATFTGSSEHIECNRILLISCQKRQAYAAEITRLKHQLTSNNTNSTSALAIVHDANDASHQQQQSATPIAAADLTGLLIFSDIQLPVKESYINKLKSGDEKRIFYFLCLIRNGIQVLQTQVISVRELIATRDTAIVFPNRMAISNVDINFRVKIDVYTFEVLPREYHKASNKTLATNATLKFFSPLKNTLFNLHHHHHGQHSTSSHGSSSSHHQNQQHQQQQQQHANHHYNEQNNLGLANGAAKTSNFIHVDTIELAIKDICTNKFKLSISSSSIPLTGLLYVNVRCMPSKSIELKGFMTLFEDVNGTGTWDRRWCFLNNYNISYWKYPDDEYRTGPLGLINLTKCVSERVAILGRDLCARKYTLELLATCADSTASTNSTDDNANLKRYRLSADTKDQAIDWLTNINYALANLRLWNPKQHQQ